MESKYMGNKNDKYYINKILDDIDNIIGITNNISYDEFIKNSILIDAILFRLIQIAENTIKISKEFKEKNNNIKWHKIVGFRNGIVHDYGKTDYSIVYEIISKDIIDLKNQLVFL